MKDLVVILPTSKDVNFRAYPKTVYSSNWQKTHKYLESIQGFHFNTKLLRHTLVLIALSHLPSLGSAN